MLFAVDEAPRRDTSAEKLASLQPAFLPDGVVTAGNSSQIVDGAAAVLVTSEAAASRLGLEPRARFVSFGLSGVDPYRMLHGNPEACRKALVKAGLSWDDISVIEVNEAFASVVLQFAHDAGLEDRFDDINPNGGGISLGHPLGATGARVTATLLNELERREARYGIACMCIGFGQAIAAVDRAGLSGRWLLVRGRGDAPLPATGFTLERHSSTRRPTVANGDLAIVVTPASGRRSSRSWR